MSLYFLEFILNNTIVSLFLFIISFWGLGCLLSLIFKNKALSALFPVLGTITWGLFLNINIPTNTCFASIHTYKVSYQERDLKIYQEELKSKKKVYEIAQKTNIDKSELSKLEYRIEDVEKFINMLKSQIAINNSTTNTEYKILGKTDSEYVVVSEKGEFFDSFIFTEHIKKANNKIKFQSCSPNIERLADNTN